jgi:8-amino-7-oxononanoate synthase
VSQPSQPPRVAGAKPSLPATGLTEGVPLRQVGPNHVELDDRRLLCFAGCDYFRFAWHPALLRAVRGAVRPGAWNVAASRLTTGNAPCYAEVEARVAEFFGAAEALLVSTGYVTNLVVAQALAGEVTHAFLDERAHVCLADAARFLNCRPQRFPHRDAAALARRLRRLPATARPLVLTDGMFGRDGAVAPLADYLAALPRRGWLLVDDAHGAGTLGVSGRGTPEHAGVQDARLIQTLTFSKAFGVYGGAVVCPTGLRARLVAGSGLFGGSTPLPLPVAAGVETALELMRREGPKRRARLQANAALLRESLAAVGIAICRDRAPFSGLVQYQQTKALPVHESMAKVSNSIWETCKTYLFTQGGSWRSCGC